MAQKKPIVWVKTSFPGLTNRAPVSDIAYSSPTSTSTKSPSHKPESKETKTSYRATVQDGEASSMKDVPDLKKAGETIEDPHIHKARDATRMRIPTAKPLTATNLAALTARDLDPNISDSDLTSISNVSDLGPESYETHMCTAPYSPSHLLPRVGKRPEPLADPEAILSSLRYELNPPDRPAWLRNLAKPMSTSFLSAAQNIAVQQRFYYDEIVRLEKLRPGGEWVFQHFGETREVERVDKYGAEKVFARGAWRRMVDGVVRGQVLDEWPLDGEGKPLGWV